MLLSQFFALPDSTVPAEARDLFSAGDLLSVRVYCHVAVYFFCLGMDLNLAFSQVLRRCILSSWDPKCGKHLVSIILLELYVFIASMGDVLFSTMFKSRYDIGHAMLMPRHFASLERDEYCRRGK